MVSVRYSHRLICDSHFCLWLSNQQKKELILSKLMYIKSSSKDWKKTHNIILEPEARECENKIDNKYLGGAFKIIEEPSFLEFYQSRISKNIVFGIELTDEPPFKCYLLTSPEKEDEYKTNKHNQEINNLKIVSGERALNIINSFFNAFTSAKESEMRC